MSATPVRSRTKRPYEAREARARRGADRAASDVERREETGAERGEQPSGAQRAMRKARSTPHLGSGWRHLI